MRVVAMLGKVVLEISNFELLTLKNCMSSNETCCQWQFRGFRESYGYDQMMKYSNSRKISDAIEQAETATATWAHGPGHMGLVAATWVPVGALSTNQMMTQTHP